MKIAGVEINLPVRVAGALLAQEVDFSPVQEAECLRGLVGECSLALAEECSLALVEACLAVQEAVSLLVLAEDYLLGQEVVFLPALVEDYLLDQEAECSLGLTQIHIWQIYLPGMYFLNIFWKVAMLERRI
ncbi:hypothetical protein ACWYXN_04335 [Janthinobacterium aestuarii]